ncbi:hypothetical protein PIB30_026898 [Stylosanthes scabra]|uniref:Uncharacterized protein n=1 Tax=Stylosanthes scabra TaxID=79078 RepID=A0ABU6WDJ3_9FABA|nr:hypothetical protein [Stylosanthes scabra]
MGKLIGAQQPARNQQEGRLLQWRSRIDRVSVEQALIPDWMRSQPEYGGEQPVPQLPVDVTRHMSSTGHGDDVWWPAGLNTWYDGWRRRRSPEVLVMVHFGGDPRGTQQYYKWFARVVRRGRFLSRTLDLVDPRWTLAPAGIPTAALHPRDDLVMPDDAPAPRRQVAPVRGKLSRRDQRRSLRMVEVGAAAHVADEWAEEQREYDRQDEPVDHGEAQVHDDHAHHADDQQDQSMSPSGMISFSPAAARAFPSPARAGTSSQPEIGPDHPAPFTADTQEHTGLDELLYHMSTCPPAEFASLASVILALTPAKRGVSLIQKSAAYRRLSRR